MKMTIMIMITVIIVVIIIVVVIIIRICLKHCESSCFNRIPVGYAALLSLATIALATARDQGFRG